MEKKNILALNHSSPFVMGAMRQLICGFMSCCFSIVTELRGTTSAPGQGNRGRSRAAGRADGDRRAYPLPAVLQMHLFWQPHLLALPSSTLA